MSHANANAQRRRTFTSQSTARRAASGSVSCIRAVIKSDRSSRVAPHLFRAVVPLLSIYGTPRSTPDDRGESSAFPRPWIVPRQHHLSGTHKAEFTLFMSRTDTETPLLIISPNFHKKRPASHVPRLTAAKAYFQVLSAMDVITVVKRVVRVCCLLCLCY